MVGALKGMPGPGDDSSSTDSYEDGEGEDQHRFRQIRQTIHRRQSLTVAIRGQYDDGKDKCGEVLFQRESVETEAPSDILEPLQFAYQSLEALSQYYQTSGIRGGGVGLRTAGVAGKGWRSDSTQHSTALP
jgi:hypothetical protein